VARVDELTTTRTEAIEMDERIDAPTDSWIAHGPNDPRPLPHTDDSVSFADLDL
jgi:hypothetical protein